MATEMNFKVITILGTRPEIIRLSRVMALLDDFVDHKIVHTGQNYDHELNQVFFNDLALRKPDFFLNIDVSSLGSAVGDIFRKTEEILIKEKPDALLILGDTNSCLSAYIAKRMHIPIYHMEAGNRCFDFNVPEEINRRIIDHLADFNLVYTEHSRRHLLSEGLPHRRIYLTGSPMREVIDYYMPKINSSKILDILSLKIKRYFIVSIHREENVDNVENLKRILNILMQLDKEYDLPIIISTHPRTRKRIEMLDTKFIGKNLQFLRPFGFTDYISLQMNAFCTISDSGTISEESAMLSFPALTLRNTMERPEAMDAGTIILTGLSAQTVKDSIKIITDQECRKKLVQIPEEYKINNTSWRVLQLIIGSARLSNQWRDEK